MNTFKLSIIIPCYNCEKTVTEAVESCYRQGFDIEELEIVAVNDASTDSTAEILKSLQDSYKNLMVYSHQKNLGGGATRNTAVSKTNADIIYCLDSDNILPPKTLVKMYELLHKKECDGIGVEKSIKFNDDNPEDVIRIDVTKYTGETIKVSDLFQSEGDFNPLYSTFMHTKDAFNKAGGYPTNHGFDTQGFAWRFLTSNLKACSCPDSADLHRVNHGESYYLREANSGKVNYNWQQVLGEHLPLFRPEIQTFIRDFPCWDITRNLMTELQKYESVFVEDYLEIIEKGYARTSIDSKLQHTIRRNSALGIYLRIKSRLKKFWHGSNTKDS